MEQRVGDGRKELIMLKVQLSKPDGSHGEWLQLPAEYDRIRRIFTALADEEHPALLITAAETDISSYASVSGWKVCGAEAWYPGYGF
ncbi:MAG: hypothetical protein ACLR0U_25340 [Enterocloster clostridioformis]